MTDIDREIEEILTPQAKDQLRELAELLFIDGANAAWSGYGSKSPEYLERKKLATDSAVRRFATHLQSIREVDKVLTRIDLERLLELAEDEDTDSVEIDNLRIMTGHYLPKGHPDYWKHHCVICGLWLYGEPEQEGYCQCE